MPLSNVVLKPSTQSLAVRGLPAFAELLPRTAVSQLSSESETEQRIASMNQGLDKCSSILNALMNQPEDCVKKNKKKANQRVKIISPKKNNKTSAKVKHTSYNKRLVCSTPLQKESKILRKDDMMSSNTVDELIEERERLKDYLRLVVHQKEQIEAEYVEIVREIPADQPQNEGVDGNERLDCNEKNNQLSGHEGLGCSDKNNEMSITPEKPYERNEQTSSVLESLMRSISEKLTLTDETINSTYNQSHIIPLKPSGAGGNHQAVKTPRETNNKARSILKKPKSDSIKTCTGTTTPPNKVEIANKEITFHSPIKEPADPVVEHVVALRGLLPSHANTQLLTLDYLLKELHGMLNCNRNIELDRLLEEIDHAVGLLPFMMTNLVSSSCSNCEQMELVRVENVDLKRKLQLAKKNLLAVKDTQKSSMEITVGKLKKEIEEKEDRRLEEETRRRQLYTQVNEVRKITEELSAENKKLLQIISEKDVKFSDEKQIWMKEKSILAKDLSSSKDELAGIRLTIRTCEKEKHIIELASKQKDSEIQRLSSLNMNLQKSISTLLADIESERVKHCARSTVRQGGRNKVNKSTQAYSKPTSNTTKKRTDKNNPEQKFFPGILKEYHESAENGLRVNLLSRNSSSTTVLSSVSTDASVSTLKTFDNIDFQNDLIHLDAKIDVVRDTIQQQKHTCRL